MAGDRTEALAGCLLGTAVGDALGLPAEGMSPGRIRRRFPGPWRHRFLLGRGMTSDDTEHAFFVAQSLLRHPSDASAFRRSLAWRLRGWILGLPAGVGLATARACLRLLAGFGPDRSGVFSAGNGPTMRAPILGAALASDPAAMDRFVEASTRLTHTDPRALTGARAVARCAAWAASAGAAGFPADANALVASLRALAPDDEEWTQRADGIAAALASGASVAGFAAGMGLSERGVTGYVHHTVPCAIYAFLRHRGDFRRTLESILECGGDADTTGAIAGALAGTAVGAAGIPPEWLDGILEWPRSVSLFRAVASRLAGQRPSAQPLGPVRYFWPALLPRNLLFLAVVLFHGFRRLLPPY